MVVTLIAIPTLHTFLLAAALDTAVSIEGELPRHLKCVASRGGVNHNKRTRVKDSRFQPQLQHHRTPFDPRLLNRIRIRRSSVLRYLHINF